jgi:hypothetical protein
MKNIKITLKKLFEFLEATDLPHDEMKPVNQDISVKTPSGEFTQILGVIRKSDKKIKITTGSGKTVTCGAKHIFIDEHDQEVYCEHANKIKSTSGVETIISKEDLGTGDVYDIAVSAPHLYVTPNGLIHHNTTFIKNMIHRSGGDATVTYDNAVMESDGIFASFIEGREKFMIMEDADTFLKSREEGNTMMHRFLNVSDGLISAAGKKLVFSTNLPSVRDIDSALMRPGRCFDVVEFRPLTRKEAQVVCDTVGRTVPSDGDSFTLASLFGDEKTTHTVKTRKVGFL